LKFTEIFRWILDNRKICTEKLADISEPQLTTLEL